MLHLLRSSMNRQNRVCWKSEKRLAEEMGCHEKTVCRAVKNLRAKGILLVSKRGRKRANNHNEYRFNYDGNEFKTDSKTIFKSDSQSQSKRTLSPQSTSKTDSESIEYSNRKGNIAKESSSGPEDDLPQKNLSQDQEDQGELPECDFIHDRGIDLHKYVRVFSKLKHLDKPGEPWFEEQLEDFYKQAVRQNWNHEADPPRAGFKKIFFRAGRAGALARCGFRPRTPEELEAERVERERLAAEKQQREWRKEKERKIIAMKQKRKDKKMRELLNDPAVSECLRIEKVDLQNLNDVRDWFRSLRRNYPEVDTLTNFITYCKKRVEKRQRFLEKRKKSKRNLLRLRLLDVPGARERLVDAEVIPDVSPKNLNDQDLDNCLNHITKLYPDWKKHEFDDVLRALAQGRKSLLFS
ncbi:MAG: HTH domain-containing protein [Desulforhopalus sp.]|nr:HTH domain-containing protein [Desulforhopalus sp.]